MSSGLKIQNTQLLSSSSARWPQHGILVSSTATSQDQTHPRAKKKCKPAFQTQTPVPSPGSRRAGWWPQPFCCFYRHSRQDPWLQEEERGADSRTGWLADCEILHDSLTVPLHLDIWLHAPQLSLSTAETVSPPNQWVPHPWTNHPWTENIWKKKSRCC